MNDKREQAREIRQGLVNQLRPGQLTDIIKELYPDLKLGMVYYERKKWLDGYNNIEITRAVNDAVNKDIFHG